MDAETRERTVEERRFTGAELLRGIHEVTRRDGEEIARLRAELAEADHRIARLEQGLWRAADALHANAEAWQVEGYLTNARIAEGQRRDAVSLLAAPTAAREEGGGDA